MAYFKKTAGLRDMWDTGKALMSRPEIGVPVGIAAAQTGLSLGASGLSALKNTIDKKRSYAGMMDLHPRLKKEDPEKMKRYFSTLSTFSPEMAKDPTVAGAWLSNVVSNEAGFGEEGGAVALLASVKDLAGVSANHTRAVSTRAQGGGGILSRLNRTLEDQGKTYLKNDFEALRKSNKKMSKDIAKEKEDLLGNLDSIVKRQRSEGYDIGFEAGSRARKP